MTGRLIGIVLFHAGAALAAAPQPPPGEPCGKELVRVAVVKDELGRGTLEHPIDLNAERFARALRQATDDAVTQLRKEPAMCGATP